MRRENSTKTEAASAEPGWESLYTIGGVAALAIVALMAIQIVVFIAWQPPETVEGWFTLFHENWLLGLMNLDVLYLVTNLLLVPLYLALYLALYRVNRGWMLVAVAAGLVGVAAYTASNTAFEVFSLSRQYTAAASPVEKSLALAAGQAVLAIYKGTAFDVYYILNAVTLLVSAALMLKSAVFSKATGVWGLLSGLLMLVPSTVPVIGPYFALASLAPWAVFSVLVAIRLFALGGQPSERLASLISAG